MSWSALSRVVPCGRFDARDQEQSVSDERAAHADLDIRRASERRQSSVAALSLELEWPPPCAPRPWRMRR